MKKQSLFLFAILVAFAAFLVSCKKQDNAQNNNSNTTPSVQCRISSIRLSNSDSTVLQFEYDSAKRLKSITATQPYFYNQKLFLYSGNFIYESTTGPNGTPYLVDTVSLTPSGKIATVIEYLATSLPKIDSMTYDNHDQLIKLVEINGPLRSEATYTWSNGDAISRDGQKYLNSISFSYYTDKKAADGDFYNIQELLTWGAHALCSSHLMKKDQDGNLSYTFDADGKITTATVHNSGSSDFVYTYSYTCD
ncbi:MAG: hypothetical protein ACTHJ0_08465 [Flavipsychrobacter sp.]